MTLLTEQDGGGGCDSARREEILGRLIRLEDKNHCAVHDDFIAKVNTMDGKITVILASCGLVLLVAVINLLFK